MPDQNECDYVIWQNRAFRFYESARLLHRQDMHSSAAYCANMSLELILKATLIYWKLTEDAASHGHGMKTLSNIVRNKVKNASSIEIPRYFFEDLRYQRLSRYPQNGKMIFIPSTFMQDLDSIFFKLIKLSPFQFNTELSNTLKNSKSKRCRNITQGNAEIRGIRKWLKEQSAISF